MFFFSLVFASLYFESAVVYDGGDTLYSTHPTSYLTVSSKWQNECALWLLFTIDFNFLPSTCTQDSVSLHGFAVWLVQNPFTLRAMERKHSLVEFILSLKHAIMKIIGETVLLPFIKQNKSSTAIVFVWNIYFFFVQIQTLWNSFFWIFFCFNLAVFAGIYIHSRSEWCDANGQKSTCLWLFCIFFFFFGKCIHSQRRTFED